ncbi:MAG TPA: hypothetical protein VLM37_07655 [Fibrobacteraceae bacterium]|nr:hypothetical protein [Fibrobacteraceae bacterium]
MRNNFRGFRGDLLLLSGLLMVSPLCADTYSWDAVAMGGGGYVSGLIPSPSTSYPVYARTDVGGAYRWNQSSSKWTPLTDWVSIDETTYLGILSIAIDPQAPQNVYMLAGTSYWNSGKTAILRSSDYGSSFSTVVVTSQFTASGNSLGRGNGERLAVDPKKGSILFCGTPDKGLFTSTDSGKTWSSVDIFPVTTTSNSNGIVFVVFDTSGATSGSATQKIYAGVSRSGSSNIYYSSDGGSSWSVVGDSSQQPTTYMPQRAIISNNYLYVTYADASGPYTMTAGAVYKYSISGGSWTDITPNGYTSRGYGAISADPDDASHLVLSTSNYYGGNQSTDVTNWSGPWGEQIFYTDDGGSSSTWDSVFNNSSSLSNNGIPWIDGNSIHWTGSITFDPYTSNRVWVTSGNGVWETDDITASAQTWKFQSKGIEETVPLDAVSLSSGVLLSAIGDYDGYKNTSVTSYATSGEYSPSMGNNTGITVAALAPKYAVRVGDSMYYSSDTGSSWTKMNTSYEDGYVALSANGASLLWNPGSSTTTLRTTNWGSSWTTVSSLSFNHKPTADQVNSAKFYAYNTSSGGFYASTDSGASFSQKLSLTSGGSVIIRAVPGREGDVWVPLYTGGLVRVTGSGSASSTISGVTACSAVGFGKSKYTYPAVYIWGTINSTEGLYRSDDTGSTWTRINDDDHEFGGPGNGQFVLGDMSTYGRVFMSTVGRGMIYGDQTSTATSSSSVQSSSSGASSSSFVSSSSGVSSSSFVSSSSTASSSSRKTRSSSSSVERSSSSELVSSSSLKESSSSEEGSAVQNLEQVHVLIQSYEVRDLLGRPVFEGERLPAKFPQGRWIVMARDTHGTLLRAWTVVGE